VAFSMSRVADVVFSLRLLLMFVTIDDVTNDRIFKVVDVTGCDSDYRRVLLISLRSIRCAISLLAFDIDDA
jgi:hypothetical protein